MSQVIKGWTMVSSKFAKYSQILLRHISLVDDGADLDPSPSADRLPVSTKCRRDSPSMERKDSLPKRVESSSLHHQITGGGNLTSSSSSSSNYSSASPNDFLRQIHAALKHRKPLENAKSNHFDQQNENSGMLCHEKSSFAAFQSQLGLDSQAIQVRDGMNEVLPSALVVQQTSPNGKKVVISEGPSLQLKQELHDEDVIKGVVADNVVCSQYQPPPTIGSSLKSDIKQPQASKTEKVHRRRKVDANPIFNVNGKQYQKLEKIGSGGSSEVYKVISPDCAIYALKKIKLKGRDYATAYGFCQEIGYLNKLKGKSNIIHLFDYETSTCKLLDAIRMGEIEGKQSNDTWVTDKTLLQQAMEEFITSRDGMITNDEYIYMVLEYGEIDLAHMLMQKCKDMDGLSWNINENWLRFYWQISILKPARYLKQMLEAVNTIHEERIVHSDLKPANFLLVKGSLKLIDFGIAKAIRSDTTNIQRDAQKFLRRFIVGTLNYMSPEAFIWSDQDQTGIKCGRPSDIWSLGCILYQMVYGKTPFSEYKTFWAKFKVITDEKHEIAYEPVPNPWLVDLMKRCLAWDRSKRWRIPQLLQHPFLVPPVPREVPSPGDHPYELLHRVAFYWNEPEVSRLCSELICVICKLERDGKKIRSTYYKNASDLEGKLSRLHEDLVKLLDAEKA
ncbi:Serine/threonine-protein kinase Aurora-2 [Platanthera zijinensis]|uniref:Serine/threonine-protein kinase Aurora-2 n=1 Tax=Platanthera zijinensis TaxID=2320716 RepID=A0AAP0G0J2_9ASPA